MVFFTKRTMWLALGLIALIGLFGWSWRHRESVPFVTRPLVTVVTPFQSGTARLAQELATTWDLAAGAVHGWEENRTLAAQNAALQSQLTSMRELWAENIRLRELLGMRTEYPAYRLLGARVIGRDYGGWTNTILIDRGTNDGLAVYMPVILPQGLAGFVSEVMPQSARVQLLIDPRTAVSGVVQRPTSRVVSIVSGNGNDPTHLEMVNIVKEGDITVGDTIVTSGYGGIYPKGLAVGTVSAVEPDPSGVVKRAVITPAASFDRLEEVFVLLDEVVAAPVTEGDVPNLVPDAPQEVKTP